MFVLRRGLIVGSADKWTTSDGITTWLSSSSSFFVKFVVFIFYFVHVMDGTSLTPCGKIPLENRSTDLIYVNCSQPPPPLPNSCTIISGDGNNNNNNGSDSSNYEYQDNVILLGFLKPRIQGGSLMLGAIPCAVFSVNDDPDLLSNYTLKFCAEAAGVPGTSQVMRKMTEMKNHNAKVIIGPDESCMSEALLASAWELPMLSYKCSDKRVSVKSTFPTFARMMPPSSKVCKFLEALLKHYSWRNIVIVAGGKASWNQTVEALDDLNNSERIIVAAKKYFTASYSDDHIHEIQSIVDATYKITRVYVFIGDNNALVDFARYMHHLDAVGKLKAAEYVIISVDGEIDLHPDINRHVAKFYENHSNLKQENMAAFRLVLKLTVSPPTNENFNLFLNQTRNLSITSPFNVPYSGIMFSKSQVPIYAAHIYDAVKVYAQAVDDAIKSGEDINNATNIMKRIFRKKYRSIQGFMVYIDENGDAEGNYSVLGLVRNESSPTKFSIQRVIGFNTGANDRLPQVIEEAKIAWIDGKPPANEPICGFDDKKCHGTEWWKILGLCTLLLIILVATIFIIRRYHYEYKLALLLWKIDFKDILLLTNEILSQSSNPANGTTKISRASFLGAIPLENPAEYAALKKPYTRIGSYKGMVVAIKPINKRNFDLTRNVRKELKLVRELRHDNLNAFIGACIDDSSTVCVVTAYCARGSLEDVLQNEDLHLDNMFISSLVADLIRGMVYLHDSEKISHGNLKSTNCLVDSRWVLQIADFGLYEFKKIQDISSPDRNKNYFKSLLFRAPELLRQSFSNPQGTYKGDVYSFGIILHHMICREGPWGFRNLEIKGIIELMKRIKNPQDNNNELCRPDSEHLPCSPVVKKCLCLCWDEDPDRRPDFRSIRVMLKEMQAGLKPNIFDNMMAIMEKYAYNLEGIVQERTNQLMEEKKKTETLLHQMLPKSVAESLKRGERVKAESFDMVTIYFSDIVGFTALSAESTPLQVVDLLNDLYTCFDSIIGHFDVYKVETIGDAYMVASGLPIRNEDKHAAQIASMALALLRKIQNFKITHRPRETLKLRIGIHSGPCVAGVVGLKMPRYCLFGDTVNTASRMESTGEALKIHVSEACTQILDKLGGFILEERGLINVKGKGEMRTFWLQGESLYHLNRGKSASGELIAGCCKLEEVSANFDPKLSSQFKNVTATGGDNEWNGALECTEENETCISPASSLPGSPLLPAKRRWLPNGSLSRHKSDSSAKRLVHRLSNNNKNRFLLQRLRGTGAAPSRINCTDAFEEYKHNFAKEIQKNGHSLVDKYYQSRTVSNGNENLV